jgi:hypothetical protein
MATESLTPHSKHPDALGPIDEEEEIQQIEVEEFADEDTEEYYPVEYSISSYGADYPVDGLVKRIEAESIYIPRFQRGYVWNLYRASRFIESLLLGLPVPAIFLSREEETQKLLVIDGQQRLRTLQYFYKGIFEPADRVFKLRGVQERFDGCTYNGLRIEDRRRLDDSILHAIIVKQEKPLGEDPSSIYHIFERLNTGGVLLQPQEIRTCIFHGGFVRLLNELNENQHWRAIFGNPSSRMRDRELILRFFALLHRAGDYSKPMKEFLNHFMEDHKNPPPEFEAMLKEKFDRTVATIHAGIGGKALKPQRAVNAALADAVMVGVARRLDRPGVPDLAQLKARYDQLLANPSFVAAISASTTADASVANRLRLATEAFSDVP